MNAHLRSSVPRWTLAGLFCCWGGSGLTWIKTFIRTRRIFTLLYFWLGPYHGQKTTETASCDPQASEASTPFFCKTRAHGAKNPRIAIVNCSNAGQFCREAKRVTTSLGRLPAKSQSGWVNETIGGTCHFLRIAQHEKHASSPHG